MEEHALFKVKVDLTTLSQLLLIFYFDLKLGESHQICTGWFGKYIFTKFIPEVNGKTFQIQLKSLLWAQVRK